MSGTETYHVVVGVVALVQARSEDEATAQLAAQLDAAGFHVYDAGPDCELISIGAFVSED